MIGSIVNSLKYTVSLKISCGGELSSNPTIVKEIIDRSSTVSVGGVDGKVNVFLIVKSISDCTVIRPLFPNLCTRTVDVEDEDKS